MVKRIIIPIVVGLVIICSIVWLSGVMARELAVFEEQHNLLRDKGK